MFPRNQRLFIYLKGKSASHKFFRNLQSPNMRKEIELRIFKKIKQESLKVTLILEIIFSHLFLEDFCDSSLQIYLAQMIRL